MLMFSTLLLLSSCLRLPPPNSSRESPSTYPLNPQQPIPKWGSNLNCLHSIGCPGAHSFSVASPGCFIGCSWTKLEPPLPGLGEGQERWQHGLQLPSLTIPVFLCPTCTGAQLPSLLGPPGLQEPLIFPLGIPTCWEERLCWEAAILSITKAISTT